VPEPQDPKTTKALAALDTMAAVWAAKTNARHAVRVMLACPDAEDRLMAYLQHAHAEGLFEGFHAGKDFRRPDSAPPPQCVAAVGANGDTFTIERHLPPGTKLYLGRDHG
jgi:hypothetical protein